jgi:unsaturated chondroitin disaccharide hydrolase
MSLEKVAVIAPQPATLEKRNGDRRHSDDALHRTLATCVGKARGNIARLAREPKACASDPGGDYFRDEEPFFSIGNWTTSFLTGMSLLALELTRDLELLRQVNRLADVYRDKVFIHGMDTMHDLGFLYSPYSVALWKLTGSTEHRRTALQAADQLARRFFPSGGYIQAWGRMDNSPPNFRGLVIIDCMMNLPLLFWASEETRTPFHGGIARRHADQTLALFVRPDDSVFHAYQFDPATGAPVGGANFCGFGVESHWARGTAWAVYGFAIAHRYTRDPRYLDVARRLAVEFIRHLDDEVVPVWDFRLPGNASRLRDSSAAAILVCGLQELQRHLPAEQALAEAESALLEALCARYVNHDPGCPGVLRDGQAGGGGMPPRNVYASWGDYFLMEALARRLHGIEGCW